MRIVNTDITMQSEHRASRSARVVNHVWKPWWCRAARWPARCRPCLSRSR